LRVLYISAEIKQLYNNIILIAKFIPLHGR
jgi:hypothetical protein